MGVATTQTGTKRPDPVELHRLCVPDPQAPPVAIGSFDTIGPLSRAAFPHRHTFYELVLVTDGVGSHFIDFVGHRLGPPQLGFITPGQVHYWHEAVGLQGVVLLFTDAFLLAHPGDRDLWHLLARRPWRSLTGAGAAEFGALLTAMRQEYRQQDKNFGTVLQAYLHLLLLCAGRLPGGESPPGPTDRAAAVTGEFTRLVAASARTDCAVSGYADRLGVSIGYLSEVVKQVTGNTPGQLIRAARVLEARRFLGGTDLTVSQVARELGFADPAYFCRFFRRETGTTPGDYRRSTG